jgi:hypothetical protein
MGERRTPPVAGSGRDDEFPGGRSGLHRFVRLDNLIEAVDAVDTTASPEATTVAGSDPAGTKRR